MQLGDILLVNYLWDPVGWLINWYTKGSYNHTAFVLDNEHIIESCGWGIRISKANKFKSKFFKVKLLRFKGVSKTKLKKVSEYLCKQIKPCSRFQWYIEYARMLCGKKRRLKSCAWFVADGLKKYGIKVCKRNARFCTPEDFNHLSNVKDVTKEF